MEKGTQKVPIPDQLVNSFFFIGDFLCLEQEKTSALHIKDNFFHEAAFYLGMESYKPWENAEECFPILLNEWKSLKQKIEALFRKRDRNGALILIKQGIGLFVEFLFWSNRLPVRLSSFDLHELETKPVNVAERLQFIMARPNLYHSFVQLAELMEEQEKQFVKSIALTKLSQKK